jgi:hypothetical protein
MVAVRAYTRVVDGKPQHVGAYIQSRAAGLGEATPASAEGGTAGGTAGDTGTANAQSPELLALARRGSHRWINVQATGGAWSEPSNLIARIGNRYGEAPRRHATEFIQAPETHANSARMLRSRISGGGIIEDLLHGRRISP